MKRVGAMRHTVSLERYTEGAPDTYGVRDKSWVAYATVWAEIRPVQGREYFQVMQVQAETTHVVRIRYQDGVRPRDRVVFGDRTFEVESVIAKREIHDEIELICKERLTD